VQYQAGLINHYNVSLGITILVAAKITDGGDFCSHHYELGSDDLEILKVQLSRKFSYTLEKNGGVLQSLPLHPFVAELSLLNGMGRVLVAALQDEKDKEIVGVGIGLVHPVPLSDLCGCAKVIPAPVFKVPNSWHFPSHR